jgi:hypothetical protein
LRVTAAAAVRKYIHEHVHLVFDGAENSKGFIGEVRDEATGQVDQVVTIDNIVTVHGYGLKIESDESHRRSAPFW